ncbi:mitochondrial import inner membrane translocase subunit Tim8 [Culicoides brevitarsis]|uniref:mitochondrial import inner membrane translocase subunit Tim8 n=1 Tax=Culicoides brevitarsis TaxID=469753 RepID=UPI00307BD2AA
MSDLGLDSKVDPELQEFIHAQQQKAQMTARILEFSETCWDKCVDKPGKKLESRQETCLDNCVNRFIDTSLFIANRYAQKIQKQSGGY